MPLGSVRAAMLAVKRGIQGILVGPTQITTSGSSTATAYSNQRKIDRTSNGVLWALHVGDYGSYQGNVLRGAYSTDNGATWTVESSWVKNYNSSGTIGSSSFFIDADDYAHVVWKSNYDGYIYYNRGTPNAGRTAWTWSAETGIKTNNTSSGPPDIVAHREGTGWVAHVVFSNNGGAGADEVQYNRVTITSGGTISASGTSTISSIYSNTVDKYPSIDFNHTGDGKTVKGGTPHLYVAWSAGTTGAGKGIRFKKATYSGGTWTWGTEREIDSTRYVANTNQWINCLYDGTRVVIPAYVSGTDSYFDLVVHERDAADTVTVQRTLLDWNSSNYVAANDFGYSGSATYDMDGNVYFVARSGGGANGTRTLAWRKWDRPSGVLEAATVLDSTAPDNPYVSAKRGHSDGRIEFIYKDGTASPYSVKYGAIK